LPEPAAGRRVLVHGGSRGIGLALVRALLGRPDTQMVVATCRTGGQAAGLHDLQRQSAALHVVSADSTDEASLLSAAGSVAEIASGIDLIVHCAGILHGPHGMQPERRLRDVRPEHLLTAFQVNALGPLLVARAFEPLLRRGRAPVFAALSARVGSIGDNRSGGWYAYRASKAALNMLVRDLAIEWGRLPSPIAAVVLHPGTVATDLSAPFLGSGNGRRVFTPAEAAARLLDVLDGLTPADTGRFLAWDGAPIPW
jgi:NAD(P)-dependent dehydrogenase (short-subunit alcohol dehydrogenase family)